MHRNHILLLTLALLAGSATNVAAQPAYMVADLETLKVKDQSSGFYSGLVEELEGVGYFYHDDGVHGIELWRTDGTALGTYLLRDLCPGLCGSTHLFSFDNLRAVGDRLFFAGSDGMHGTELWVTDGTALGTLMVRDILPGYWSSGPAVLVAASGQLLFTADDGIHGREIWRSDGTAKGTYMVADVGSGVAGCFPNMIAPAGSLVYFNCSAWEAPRGLWVTDGTALGTQRLSDQQIWSAQRFKGREYIALSGARLLFSGEELPSSERELWISDGTVAGTERLVDLRPGAAGSWPSNFIEVGGEVLFTADSDDITPGQELWRTDGTAAGTTPIALPPGVEPKLQGGLFSVLNDTLIFAAFEPSLGLEPWKLQNGALSLVHDIRPGGESSIDPIASGLLFNSSLFTTVGPKSLVLADDGVHGLELWATDGTGPGTTLVSELATGNATPNLDAYIGLLRSPTFGGQLLLRVHDPLNGYRLHKSDGSSAGTGFFETISGGGSSFLPVRSEYLFYSATGPFCFEAAGDRLVFGTARALPDRFVTWGTDGSAAGTDLLTDPFPASNFESNLLGCGSLDGDVLFGGAAGEVSGIWRTGGRPESTELVLDLGLPGGPLSAALRPYFVAFDDGLVFSADGSLFRSDGTASGTQWLYGPLSSSDGGLAASSNRIFFSHDELYASDGTAGGSSQVVDLNGSNPSFPADLTPLEDGRLLFVAFEDAFGEELWVSDEAEKGTQLVRDLLPGARGGMERPFGEHSRAGRRSRIGALGARAVLAANDGAHGSELWVTDGTAPGTYLLKDIHPGDYPSTPRNLTRFGDRVYFTAESELEGLELWATDGTYEGTVLVKDIAPGAASSIPDDLVVRDDVIYFSAWSPNYGREAWKSDGTSAGTVRITDIAPGPKSSSPQRFARAGNRLYFSATDQIHGYELWAISDDGSIPLFLDGFESGGSERWSSVESDGFGGPTP